LEHGILDSDAAYPALFRRKLASLFPHAMISVVNSGLGGDGSDGVLARLERDCLRYAPQLVTVCVGLNDARKGREYVPAFMENLRQIIGRVKETGAEVILLTPNTRGDALQDDGTVTEFIRAIRLVARETDTPLADVHAIYQGAIRMGAAPADLLSNRVSHPTREGHQIFANALVAFFQPVAIPTESATVQKSSDI
jgi:lysophospholipase L1-like esterase